MIKQNRGIYVWQKPRTSSHKLSVFNKKGDKKASEDKQLIKPAGLVKYHKKTII